MKLSSALSNPWRSFGLGMMLVEGVHYFAPLPRSPSFGLFACALPGMCIFLSAVLDDKKERSKLL